MCNLLKFGILEINWVLQALSWIRKVKISFPMYDKIDKPHSARAEFPI